MLRINAAMSRKIAAFIWFLLVPLAFIRGQRLIEGGVYSNSYVHLFHFMTERLKHTFQLFVYFKYCLCYFTIFKRTRCNLVTFVNLTGTNIFLYFIGKSITTELIAYWCWRDMINVRARLIAHILCYVYKENDFLKIFKVEHIGYN